MTPPFPISPPYSDVKVDAYGAIATLQKVAQVSVRDPRSLLVNVFDGALTSSVEKAIRNAGLNLNPSQESSGKITVPIPRPTKETRELMGKVCSKAPMSCRCLLEYKMHSDMTN
jgi:ribosome recycling factor